MFTYDQNTLRLLGMPLFTLVLGGILLAALAALWFGVFYWRQPAGKLAVIASTCVLLLFAVALILVLFTVDSGSMG